MEVGLLIAAALPAGFLIGAFAIGCVLLAPALSALAGTPVHDAVALSLAGFVVTGVAAVVMQSRASLRAGWWILASAAPGAAMGATALQYLPGPVVSLLIAVCVQAAGLRIVWGRTIASGGDTPTAARGAAIGAATGAGSALTGTGGALILMPILLRLGVDIRTTIALGQAIQLPIALAATIANAGFGRLDAWNAIVVGAALLAGMAIGTAAADRLAARDLRRWVGVLLIGAGALLGVGAVVALWTWVFVPAE